MDNAIDTTPTVPSALPIAPATQPASADAERARVKDLAQQFESMLISQMLKEMRSGMMSDDDQEGGFGAGAFSDSINSQLGLALSRSGGLGLADIMRRAIESRMTGQAATAAVAPAAASLVGGAESPAPPTATLPAAELQTSEGLDDMPTGPVTSAFGWRSDPMTGQAKFHAGRDIRMAYGQDVHSAAAGTVTFAGERSGYGTTVEVDHGGGLVTRYAHLSAPAVSVGQAVASGQVIASSGNSGRSTGPHLHFEVLDHGQAVDPATAIQGFSRVADSHNARDLQVAGPPVG